jgi:hypothetical protein
METVAQVVAGKTVLDLGCGTGFVANQLREAGATSVLEVDQHETAPISRNIEDGPGKLRYDVAMISWPTRHWPIETERWLQRAPTVMYLGSNVNGTTCGSEALFFYLRRRHLHAYVPHPRNSLVVVTHHLGVRRQMTHEEWCGMQRELQFFSDTTTWSS